MISDNMNIFGIIERENHLCYFIPIEKSEKTFCLGTNKILKNNDFVEIELVGRGRYKEAVVVKNYGSYTMEMLNEVLITQKHKIPHIFGEALLNECRNFPDFEKDKDRINLSHLPFVTIDGDDSKDFDDAVYASRTDNGFDLIVAIADVAFYVKPNTKLDQEAYKRGNSVYLPQMVIPMLPEALSNDLCSLKPKVKRPVIACFMNIDKSGNLLNYEFKRAIITSHARLTYKEVEDAINGKFNDNTKKIFTTSIQPIYAAYFALEQARQKRGTLEIETDEIKIKFNKKGHIYSIEKEENLTSHKIIEEFMIAANVSAAKFLKDKKIPIMYRIHERPMEEKLKELKPLLKSFNLKLPDHSAILPKHLNTISRISKEKKLGFGIDDLILRLQSQAKYNPNNIGHFGLSLKEYVHFTSPIRRYADLLIHRAIIYKSKMDTSIEIPDKISMYEDMGIHLCLTERRAVSAERDITSRYLSMYLKPMIGADMEVKISGFSNAGIFVKIESIGAEGLIPMRTLPKDYYKLTDANSGLRGASSKLKLNLGDILTANLREAAPITGGLIFSYIPPKISSTSKPKKKKIKDKKLKSKNRKKGEK